MTTSHMEAPPSVLAACTQNFCSIDFSRPATVTKPWLPGAALASIISPTSCASLRPSSNEKTPAAQRAAYSITEHPAVQRPRAATSGRCLFSCSRAARATTKRTEWTCFATVASTPRARRRASVMPPQRMGRALAIISSTSGSRNIRSVMTLAGSPKVKRTPTGSGSSLFGQPSGSAVSCLTAKARPFATTLIQPSAGPVPVSRTKRRRACLSSTSWTRAPVDSLSASCREVKLSSFRTRRPPVSAPPTTSQSCCGTAPGAPAGPACCGDAVEDDGDVDEAALRRAARASHK
mmetsp:Transcript_469/g.1267  ORF Transcript_469/g.1267 Transcript_469/m.1267 type:complete len:292 (-) Transcript_469:158-1033(-)